MEYRGEQLLVLVAFRMSRFLFLKYKLIFFSGFPPKLPTRAFHSSEESIYGAGGGGDFQQQTLKENPIVFYLILIIEIRLNCFSRVVYKD